MRKQGKKAQVVMEFLMTYGWAILIGITSISSLSYFGVISPDKFLAENCNLPPGITCLDFAYNEEGKIFLSIKNNLGFTLDDFYLVAHGSTYITTNAYDKEGNYYFPREQVSSDSCPGTIGLAVNDFKNGDQIKIELTICSEEKSEDPGDVDVYYTKRDTGIAYTDDGILNLRIIREGDIESLTIVNENCRGGVINGVCDNNDGCDCPDCFGKQKSNCRYTRFCAPNGSGECIAIPRGYCDEDNYCDNYPNYENCSCSDCDYSYYPCGYYSGKICINGSCQVSTCDYDGYCDTYRPVEDCECPDCNGSYRPCGYYSGEICTDGVCVEGPSNCDNDSYCEYYSPNFEDCDCADCENSYRYCKNSEGIKGTICIDGSCQNTSCNGDGYCDTYYGYENCSCSDCEGYYYPCDYYSGEICVDGTCQVGSSCNNNGYCNYYSPYNENCSCSDCEGSYRPCGTLAEGNICIEGTCQPGNPCDHNGYCSTYYGEDCSCIDCNNSYYPCGTYSGEVCVDGTCQTSPITCDNDGYCDYYGIIEDCSCPDCEGSYRPCDTYYSGNICIEGTCQPGSPCDNNGYCSTYYGEDCSCPDCDGSYYPCGSYYSGLICKNGTCQKRTCDNNGYCNYYSPYNENCTCADCYDQNPYDKFCDSDKVCDPAGTGTCVVPDCDSDGICEYKYEDCSCTDCYNSDNAKECVLSTNYCYNGMCIERCGDGTCDSEFEGCTNCPEDCLDEVNTECCSGTPYDPTSQVCCGYTVYDGECCLMSDCEGETSFCENHQCVETSYCGSCTGYVGTYEAYYYYHNYNYYSDVTRYYTSPSGYFNNYCGSTEATAHKVCWLSGTYAGQTGWASNQMYCGSYYLAIVPFNPCASTYCYTSISPRWAFNLYESC